MWGFPIWTFGLGFVVFLLWNIFWKGISLWTSAKRDEKYWFLVFLFVNTMGILEIAYLFFITKEGFSRIKKLSTNTEQKS